MKKVKKVFGILCALTMLTSVMPIAAFAEGSGFYADGKVRIEGEWYTSGAEVHATGVKPNTSIPGESEGLNLTSGSVAYDENDKPYVSYSVYLPNTGIYELEYVANYIADEGTHAWLSPFSVSLNNGDAVMFTGDTPYNGAVTTYEQLTRDNGVYGRYKLPVYLEAGTNKITFTVEGARYGNGSSTDYVFYLDYFQFTYKGVASNTITVEAEALTAGNVPSGNIAPMTATAANGGIYYQFNAVKEEGAYLEYTVFSAITGDYQLLIAGNNTDYTPALKGWDGGYSIVINDGQSISVGSAEGQPSDVTTLAHYADTLDAMAANKTVTLKKGLNKVRVLLDKPANNGNHVMQLDYIEFSPIANTVAIEAESVNPAYVNGYTPKGGTSWIVNDIPTTTGSITALDFNIVLRSAAGAVGNDSLENHPGGIEITYAVYIPKDGSYDMSINMAGYVEDTEASSYYLPVKLRFDDNEAFRLACEGVGTYVENDGQTPEVQPEATIEKLESLGVTGAGTTKDGYQNHSGFYNTYRLLVPQELSAGMHTITFVLSDLPGRGYSANASRGKFSLDSFVLTAEDYVPEPASAILTAEKQTLVVGDSAELFVQLFDENGVSVADDGSEIIYKSSAPGVADAEGGILTAYNTGTATITATVHDVEAKLDVIVYNEEAPFVITGVSKAGGKISISGVYAGYTAPEASIITAGYGVENGITTTLTGMEPERAFPDASEVHPGMIWTQTLTEDAAIVNSERIAVFVWDSIDDMKPLYNVTVIE